jgi:hypothetical protein
MYFLRLNKQLRKFGWFGISLSLLFAETAIALLIKPEHAIKNMRDLPEFISYLSSRWSDESNA